jgi:hypothetical protein
MNREAGWMDLVDGDVDMDVICIAVHGADALMLTKPQPITNIVLDGRKSFLIGIFPRPETNQQMKGFIAGRASIAMLGRQRRKSGGTIFGCRFFPKKGWS